MAYPNLDSLKRRDGDAWISFLGQVAPKIRSAIQFILHKTDPAVVQDLESDVFYWMIKSVHAKNFNDLQHLEARARIKAHSVAIDYIRRESKNPVSMLDNLESADNENKNHHANHQPSPADELIENERQDAIMKVLETINPKRCEVLKMIFLKGYTFEETATALVMPIGTVGVYCSRGLSDFRRAISQHPQLLKDLKETYGTLRLTLKIALTALFFQ